MGKLLRTTKGRVMAGVCAGVAEHFGWQVQKVRLVWVLLAVLSLGAMVLFYLILWFLMPDAGAQKMSYEERMELRLGARSKKAE